MIEEDDIVGGKDALEWTGHWWLPSNPDKKIPGVLFPAGDRGPSLELMGSFHAGHDREHQPIDIVHGTTPSAEYVTLQNLIVGASSEDARGQCRTSYEVELAVTGQRFTSVDAITFQDLGIRYSTLVNWIARPLVDVSQIRGQTREEGAVKVLPELEKRMYHGNGYVLTLDYSRCWETTGRGMTLSIYPDAHIALHWDAPRPLGDIIAVVHSIRDFLTFATCVHTRVEAIEAEPVRHTRFGHAHDMLLFHRSVVGERVKHEAFLPLFSLEDVLLNLETVVESWFQKGQELQPVIDLHLARIYNPQMHAEGRFLSGVQALEAFHRRMRDSRELPEDEHEVRIAEVLDGSPEKLRKWLRQKLQYSNELGLRQRIKAVCVEFKDILDDFKLKRKPFADAVCNTRNYLTHYDPKLERKAAKGGDLHKLAYGLHLLVDLCLLQECGISRKEIPRLAGRRHMDMT